MPWAYHDGRVEVVPVTLQEVIERARALYPDLGELNPATARTWAKRGMWREPSTGQGQGARGGWEVRRTARRIGDGIPEKV